MNIPSASGGYITWYHAWIFHWIPPWGLHQYRSRHLSAKRNTIWYKCFIKGMKRTVPTIDITRRQVQNVIIAGIKWDEPLYFHLETTGGRTTTTFDRCGRIRSPQSSECESKDCEMALYLLVIRFLCEMLDIFSYIKLLMVVNLLEL